VHIKTTREAAWHWLDGKQNVPYKWAGNELKDGGYDCSGLYNGALRKFGITDRDHTAADLAEMFPDVPKADIRPADALFWRSKATGKVVHVEAVWAIFGGKVYSIGASGGGPWVTTRSDADRNGAYVQVREAIGWTFARNPFKD
jgi:hypothetical protein